MWTKKEFYGDRNRRPVGPRVNPDGVPDALKAMRHWVLWRYQWKAKEMKWDKPPFPPSGKPAKTDDPTTWAGFDQAFGVYQAGGYDGIGFELKVSGMIGIDPDECRDPYTGGILLPWVVEVINRANTFTDINPSDLGFKLIGRGVWPEGRRHKWRHPAGGTVEVYTQQYFTVTGRRPQVAA